MAINKIEKGNTLTVKDMRSGTGAKGDWCFCKFEGSEKITVWPENKDFKCAIGDSVEILDIKSVCAKTKKVNEKFYTNFNVYALLKNKGAKPTADFDNLDDITFDGADEDFI
jgi:hypothetical protein